MWHSKHHERDCEIMRAVLCGATLRAAGLAGGVTTERVRQMMAQMKRKMLHPDFLDEPYPTHDYHNTKQVRAHKDFWLRRLEKYARSTKSNDWQ